MARPATPELALMLIDRGMRGMRPLPIENGLPTKCAITFGAAHYCARCGEVFYAVSIGKRCPACELELLRPAWADTPSRAAIGALLIAVAIAAWSMVLQ